MKNGILIFTFLLVYQYVCAQFPPKKCDSLPEYAYLRPHYQKFIGKNVSSLFKTDSIFNATKCYMFDTEGKYFHLTIGNPERTIHFNIEKGGLIIQEDIEPSLFLCTIKSINIMIFDMSIETDLGNPIKCILYIE